MSLGFITCDRCDNLNGANWWIKVRLNTTIHVLVTLTLTFILGQHRRMHLSEYHVPFLRFSKYNLFLPAFLDNCTNHSYMAIAIRASITVSSPCDVFT
jgi:hypothetical protein